MGIFDWLFGRKQLARLEADSTMIERRPDMSPMLTAKISIKNDRKSSRCFYIEPWGEDYTLLPDENFDIIANGRDIMPWFYIVEFEDGTSVFCEETSMFEVWQQGQLLECGHNRGAQS